MYLDPEDRPRLLHLLERAPRPAAPDGAPPSADELMALSDNTLAPERRRQVLAWLAGDGELTRDWVRMQQDWERVRGELKKPPAARRARRTTWLWLGPLTGLAAVATLVGVLVLPVWRGDPTAALDDLAWPAAVQPLRWAVGAKGPTLITNAPDVAARAAFAGGVAEVLARAPADWARLRAHYAERGSECAGGCPAAQRTVWRWGRWAARARLACLSETPPPPEVLRVLIAARAAVTAADAPTGTDLNWLCAEAERLFERYE